jgi:hypothetical protein
MTHSALAQQVLIQECTIVMIFMRKSMAVIEKQWLHRKLKIEQHKPHLNPHTLFDLAYLFRSFHFLALKDFISFSNLWIWAYLVTVIPKTRLVRINLNSFVFIAKITKTCSLAIRIECLYVFCLRYHYIYTL